MCSIRSRRLCRRCQECYASCQRRIAGQNEGQRLWHYLELKARVVIGLAVEVELHGARGFKRAAEKGQGGD